MYPVYFDAFCLCSFTSPLSCFCCSLFLSFRPCFFLSCAWCMLSTCWMDQCVSVIITSFILTPDPGWHDTLMKTSPGWLNQDVLVLFWGVFHSQYAYICLPNSGPYFRIVEGHPSEPAHINHSVARKFFSTRYVENTNLLVDWKSS